MTPIEYIPIMMDYYRSQGLGEYPIYKPEGQPWITLKKPLRECRIALVCSAGISRRDQVSFQCKGHDDLSFREIPTSTAAQDLVINYEYFDHSDADRDINCVLPLDRLRELEEEGFIAAFCPTFYSMGIGRWLDPNTPEKLQREVAVELAGRCKLQEADAVLLVPT